jgi:glycosyltransferase involved in cell wall biosynthesis
VTVFNEADTVGPLVASLVGGELAPAEIVIADGGSTDGTLNRLREIASFETRLKPLLAPGNRSVGRNAAVRAARNGIIACTDAGAEVDPSWLAEITRPFAEDPAVEVVAGFYRPDGSSAFERAAGVVSAPALGEINPDRFLPSTRSIAFRRAAFEKVGGFDESLAHNEDTPFALALKSSGARFAFAPAAIVRWRPRGTLSAFVHQHRRFGIGDGESRVQGWFYRTLAAKYALAFVLLIVGVWFRPAWWMLLVGVILFIAQQARRGIGRVPLLSAIFVVPFLKVAYDLAYLSGYLKGRLGPRASQS